MTTITIKLNAADNAMIDTRDVILPADGVELKFSSHYFA